MVLFLSKYPHAKEQFRDGFFQRVLNIDFFYIEEERVYLDIKWFKNFKKNCFESDKRTEYSCNLFFHLFFIVSLFKKSNLVYIQSLHNSLYSFIFITLIKNKYVLDLHGVVPEELGMQGMNFKAIIFSFIERLVYPKLNVCIAVTNSLANHYKKKFPSVKASYIIYAILPNNIDKFEINNLLESSFLNVIYSGNTQRWQNIDLMLKTIKSNQSDKIKYTILTGELDRMQVLLDNYGLKDLSQVEVLSVEPSELSRYYKNSHYGFILRDDILVNNVACPTKLIEYLNYGIIPIVLSENIGDFKDLGYDYVSIDDFNINLPMLKSKNNQQIVQLLKNSNNVNLNLIIKNIINTDI